ncbi:MAG: hypothetical protein LBT62_05465 [Deltaproteobacteria bacterium]|jgi:hypothetical protein|nr:hypothetical protein [Deltaproteobacteria bacterium]
MPLLFIIGCVLILGGLVLFISWIGYFWLLFKALFPLAIMSLGAVLAYFGWEERKDQKGAFLEFSSPAEATRYQAEALAYQEKIDTLTDAQSLDVDPIEQVEQVEHKTDPELKPIEADKITLSKKEQ